MSVGVLEQLEDNMQETNQVLLHMTQSTSGPFNPASSQFNQFSLSAGVFEQLEKHDMFIAVSKPLPVVHVRELIFKVLHM